MKAFAGYTFYFDFEVEFMKLLQNLFGEVGAKVFTFLTLFGEETVLILVLGFLYWCYDKKMGEYVGLLIITGCIMNPLIKNVFWRRRPYFDHPDIKCFRAADPHADIYDIAAQGYSFPSGHSTNSVTAYSGIAVYKRKNRLLNVLGVVMPLLVGLSRCGVGVHYPTDVLCGWLSGIICIIVIGTIYNKVPEEKRWILYLIIFLISCVGFFYCDTNDYYASLGLMGGFFLAMQFEKGYIGFENTRSPLIAVIRLALGVAAYLLLNGTLKWLFSGDVFNASLQISEIVRFFRYLIVSFLVIGVYPLAFKVIK